MSQASDGRQIPVDSQPATRRRNPIIVFLGFAFLGAALALLLFGGDLFGLGGDGPAARVGEAQVSTVEQSVLDQVSELPVGETSGGQDNKGYLEVGDVAHDFTLNDLDGEAVSLTDFRGQPVIVNFWATWCAPCRLEMPALQAAYERYQGEGLVILALDQAEPAAVARNFFYDEMGLTFRPLLDENSEVASAYSSYGVLPSTFFIDAEGIVTAIHRGPLTEGQLADYLAIAGVGGS